jgi:hypothetical protein
VFARVAKFEGGQGDVLRRTAAEINSRAASGPPEGVPAQGFMMLIDPDSGRSRSVVLFETEDDLRQGDATLNTMTPTEGGGTRSSVETYEVGVDIRL